jgi:hypothetical protein
MKNDKTKRSRTPAGRQETPFHLTHTGMATTGETTFCGIPVAPAWMERGPMVGTGDQDMQAGQDACCPTCRALYRLVNLLRARESRERWERAEQLSPRSLRAIVPISSSAILVVYFEKHHEIRIYEDMRAARGRNTRIWIRTEKTKAPAELGGTFWASEAVL